MTPNHLLQQLGIYVQPSFADVSECADLRAAIDTGKSYPARVYSREEQTSVVDDRHRKTTQIGRDAVESDWLFRRLQEIRPRLGEHFSRTLTKVEPPSFLIYEPGDYFHRHRDTEASVESDEPDIIRRRKVSGLLFLSSEGTSGDRGDYEGGRLTFFGLMDFPGSENHGLPVRGETGLLVAFPAEIHHMVTEVVRGRRYCASTWFY